ncbi:LysR family transcriptional regulator [Pelagibacterium limicola]|uniref:LysR family transcriptional regulator n=1 Tax=Pelagibacterium limicola TaxID=2791022 RepID=UPI0018AFABF6|nr:LysR family transcriptional regulator [Pelagibacterium limicola]
MSNRLPAFDWNQMRAFLATVEAGSLSGGARVLGLTQPTLSRQIGALEQHLGLLLFERVGRRLVLTEAGRQLVDHVRAMGDAADRISLAASGQSTSVEGLVRVTAIDIVAARILPPILAALRDTAPGIVIELVVSNSINDLMRREADIAIRHVRPDQPDLVARRCPDGLIRLYAAKTFLDRFGRSADPGHYADAPFIGFQPEDDLIKELVARGVPISHRNYRVICANSLVGLDLIRQGLGIGASFADAVGDLADIEPVLPQIEPLRAPMWVVAHRELQTSRRIRMVFDAIADGLDAALGPPNREFRANPG